MNLGPFSGDAHVQAVHPHGTMTSDGDSHDGEVGVDFDLPTVTGVASTSTPTLTPGECDGGGVGCM